MSVDMVEEGSAYGIKTNEIDFTYKSVLKIPMMDSESSLIANQVLSVDEELQPLKLKKTIESEDQFLIV